METELQDWIVNRHDKIPPDEKRNFLKLLKEDPETVTRTIKSKLMDWATLAVMDLGIIITTYDNDEDAAELTRVFQEHFKEEMEAL